MATDRLQDGQRFGRYVVVRSRPCIGNSRLVDCQCDCGKYRTVDRSNLLSGRTLSCGCLRSERVKLVQTIHGESGNHYHGRRPSVEYKTWLGIKDRCLKLENNRYQYYGARGIKICESWLLSFDNFLSDMGRRPSPKHSIDRIDNNGNYEPGNCRWATTIQQQANTSRNKFIILNGERIIVAEAIRRVGIKSTTFWERIRRGWSFDRALLTEVQN